MHSCKNITQWTKPLLQSLKIEKNFYYDSLSVIVTLNIPAKIDLIQFILVPKYSPQLVRCSFGKPLPFKYNCWCATETSPTLFWGVGWGLRNEVALFTIMSHLPFTLNKIQETKNWFTLLSLRINNTPGLYSADITFRSVLDVR